MVGVLAGVPGNSAFTYLRCEKMRGRARDGAALGDQEDKESGAFAAGNKHGVRSLEAYRGWKNVGVCGINSVD